MVKYRYKVTLRSGRSYYTTTKETPQAMGKWKSAYNRNYANGKRAPKSMGVENIKNVPTVRRKVIRRSTVPRGLFSFKF